MYKTSSRQLIVPANTHHIALLGVRNVVRAVSDQDLFVRIRKRFATTMVVKVSVLTSSSLKPRASAFTYTTRTIA